MNAYELAQRLAHGSAEEYPTAEVVVYVAGQIHHIDSVAVEPMVGDPTRMQVALIAQPRTTP